MTGPQTSLYWREVNAWRENRKTAGLPCDEHARHELHNHALGRHKSSKDFSNRDFDLVLGALRAVSQPGNLKAQLHVDESEDKRKADILRACDWECTTLWRLGKTTLTGDAVPAYIGGTCRRINGCGPDEATSAQLAKVLGALQRSVAVARKTNPAAAHSLDTPGQPYASAPACTVQPPPTPVAPTSKPAQAYSDDEQPW